jgi:hypothetical protein
LNIAFHILPDHVEYVKKTNLIIHEKYSRFSSNDVRYMLSHILYLIDLEQSSKEKLKDFKIFDTAYDKIEFAGECLRNEDFSGVFNNLNTALELILKDKVDVPSTLKGINTANILEILVSEKVKAYQFLDEAKKRVVFISNEIKHHAYSPTQIDAIRAIRIMEELMKRIKDVNWELSEAVQNKIFKNLYVST